MTQHESFKNLTLVSFESRMQLPMQRLIEKHGGKAIVAPSMREIAVKDNKPVLDFYSKLKNGDIDVLILLTGVATRTFIKIVESGYPKEEIIQTLSAKTKVVVRGPKPTAVCKMHGIPIVATAPEPNTWEEVLEILDQNDLIKNKTLGILEYGISNKNLISALLQKAKDVLPLPVYTWDLPEDTTLLKNAIEKICFEKVDATLFTSANQLENIIHFTRELNLEKEFRRGLLKTVIASIGPVASERLAHYQFYADMEAKPNKMDTLVEQLAEQIENLLKKKKTWIERTEIRQNTSKSSNNKTNALTHQSTNALINALNFKQNKHVPIWLMRQAGRYMAEYQMIRKKCDFLELCKNPDLACEVTLGAVERLGVDAAIIFSDILIPLEPMGMKVKFLDHGPAIENRITSPKDVQNLRIPDTKTELSKPLEAISKTRQNLESHIPLLGFCGAPFTLASYMIEGGGSKNYINTKKFMYEKKEAWFLMMEKLSRTLSDYLKEQVKAGAQAVQVFDSWAGCLSPDEFKEFVFPFTKKIFDEINSIAPTIYFGGFSSSLLPLQKDLGSRFLSLDWRVNLNEISKLVGPKIGIQGNLDPTLLFSKPSSFLPVVKKILTEVGSRPGFIFNLGHGILPGTPVNHVLALVDYVKEWEIK